MAEGTGCTYSCSVSKSAGLVICGLQLCVPQKCILLTC